MIETTFDNLITTLAADRERHAPGTQEYVRLKDLVRPHIQALFGPEASAAPKPFPPFGEIVFPYHRMGAIDSLDLFGLDELIIFSFYWTNRSRYRRTIDIGANIGLHSLMMARCGFSVRSFEPDPEHFRLLQGTLAANMCSAVQPINQAVSNKRGAAEFLRVLGNTTGSHLAGAKKNPYGEIQKIPVTLEDIRALKGAADLFKIDAEGHEGVILQATGKDFWSQSDALVEVGTPENAKVVYDHMTSEGVSLFSQKRCWKKVSKLEDMPTSYREGTLFVSQRAEMPWS
jgi:FkbM family methyltransferase